VDADDLVTRHREQAERVSVPEILFRRERKSPEVFERTQVVGVRANRLALCAERWNAIVGVAN
jgi:hypothetical protein